MKRSVTLGLALGLSIAIASHAAAQIKIGIAGPMTGGIATFGRQMKNGADQAIALAVSPRAFEQAYGSLRRGGKLVFVALPADNEVTVPIFQTVLNGITIVGSIVGTRTDLREVFELHSAGKTHVTREVRPLAEVNESIADVEAGRVAARIVFAP